MKPTHCRDQESEHSSLPDWPDGLPTWRANAACLDMDPETFFPQGTTGSALDQIDRAKAVCANCPVITACLDYALDTGQDAGVWGGTTEDERRRIRRKRQRERRPYPPGSIE